MASIPATNILATGIPVIPATNIPTTTENKSPTNEKTAKRNMRKRADPIDATGYEELIVAVVGSVDSGKSTTIGTLVGNILDDGKGLARSIVFVHPHERETGRTSDISYQYIKDEESKRVITFVDLAGHETYLKTTLSGLTAATPDFAIVCISDKITKMTKEHMGLCYALGIPFIVLFTKSDIVPLDITAALINSVKKMVTSQRSKVFHFREISDFKMIENHQSNKLVPFLTTSNKTGQGLDLVRHALRIFKPRPKLLPDGFVVEHVYNVQGHGIVVSGIAGHDINVNDELFMGPFSKGDFSQVSIRSIHNDYRFDIKTLPAGKRGCLALGIRAKEKNNILRKGLILSKEKPVGICKEFIAEILVLHHATTIRAGYNAYVNCGMLREPVKFIELTDSTGKIVPHARAGDRVQIKMQFQRNLNYVLLGQQIAFREGTIRGFGNIISIL